MFVLTRNVQKLLDGRGMDKGILLFHNLKNPTWQQEETNRMLFDGDKGKDIHFGGNNQPAQLF